MRSVSPEATGGGWRILLDGRVVKTPKRAELLLPPARWPKPSRRNGARKGRRSSPLPCRSTKLANTALDAVAPNLAAVAEDVVGFAGRDLICYRATTPESLGRAPARGMGPAACLGGAALRRQAHRDRGRHAGRPATGKPCRAANGACPVRCLRADGAAHHDDAHRLGRAGAGPCRRPAVAGGKLGRRPCRRGFPERHMGRGREARKRRELRFADMRAASEFFRLSRMD